VDSKVTVRLGCRINGDESDGGSSSNDASAGRGSRSQYGDDALSPLAGVRTSIVSPDDGDFQLK